MNDEHLEQQIRSLRPNRLPPDLTERLEAEPIRPLGGTGRVKLFIAAAAVFATAACIAIWFRPVDTSVGVSVPRAVSILQQDSTLLNSRTLALREHNGQLWEVSEEEWRDDTVAFCSASPAKLRSTVIRRETVCAPVDFQ